MDNTVKKENKDNLAKEYAGQIVDVARQAVRFNVTDKLDRLDDNNTEKPFLNVFSDYSVYRLSIFTYTEGAVEANVPIGDIALINERTRIASEYLFRELNGLNGNAAGQGSPKKDEGDDGSDQNENILPNTPAFTYKMRMGQNMKGKTPVEYIAENQNRWKDARRELLNQVSYMEKNADKYPENRKAANAIKEALDLVAQKKLTKAMSDAILSKKAEDAATENGYDNVDGPSFLIYDSPMKYFTKKMENNIKKCYQVKIACYPKSPYPYRVTIENFLAPVGENHMIQRSLTVDGSFVSKKFTLTEQEWLNTLYLMTKNMEDYRMYV